jgi:RimJ/RimL family protein N-acetyltransferase
MHIDPSWQKSITLKSGRQVLLRYPQSSDTQQLMKFINDIIDEEAFILANKKVTLKEEEEYLEKVMKDMKDGKFIKILAVDNDRIIAAVDGIQLRGRMSHLCSLGISISKDFRGEGLGSILIEELFEQAQKYLGAKQITLTCFVTNTPAISLYKKMGFQEYGRLPQALQYKDKYLDQVKMYRKLDHTT